VAILPARVRKPRDKAKVEVAVQVVQRWILARLRNQRFFSLAEFNAAIAALVAELNNRIMRHLGASRRKLYEQVERPPLQPLPAAPYQYAESRRCRVGLDYHVEIDGHFYSVPLRLLREPLEARNTAATVELFHRGKRVAAHVRSTRRGRHSTLPDHMPSAHRACADWTHERMKLARFIEQLDLKAIILHEQPTERRTIIEKIEAYSDVGFAVVLITGDDVGSLREKADKPVPRARQNVILELGYFIARLGRERVCPLYEDGVRAGARERRLRRDAQDSLGRRLSGLRRLDSELRRHGRRATPVITSMRSLVISRSLRMDVWPTAMPPTAPITPSPSFTTRRDSPDAYPYPFALRPHIARGLAGGSQIKERTVAVARRRTQRQTAFRLLRACGFKAWQYMPLPRSCLQASAASTCSRPTSRAA
jgi:hypothetical protein